MTSDLTTAFGLQHWLEQTLEGMGFDLVDIERIGKGTLLRIFIDRIDAASITVEDCAEVSRHLTHALSVAEIDYDRLEVSSPGLDRVLRKPRDFQRFIGSQIKVKLRLPRQERKLLQGVLLAYQENEVIVMQVDGVEYAIPLQEIDRARIVPVFN